MPAPPEILKLVARFEEHSADYRAGKYNETQLRRDFLDPLFTDESSAAGAIADGEG